MAWDLYTEESLNEQVASIESNGGDYITKSGCIEVVLSEVKIKKSPKSQAEFLTMLITDENGRTAKDGSICFKDKKGNPTKEGTAMVNQLIRLAGVQNELATFPACLNDKEVGIFFHCFYTDKSKFAKQFVQGFYHLETKLTVPELKENPKGEPLKYNEMKESYEVYNAQPRPEVKEIVNEKEETTTPAGQQDTNEW